MLPEGHSLSHSPKLHGAVNNLLIGRGSHLSDMALGADMKTSYKNFLLTNVVIMAVMPSLTFAQEVVPAEDDDVLVVFGQALSQRRAIEVKRNSDSILDAISQDDIGRLPDLNTAQALVRVPGVAVQNDQGEARFPIVRGLNPTYNRTTIDGLILASPERGSLGRAVPLDLIPASLVARLEVQKSITPDLDHNAIGGTINLVTRSAFDQDEPFLLGSAFVGSYEQSGVGTTLDGDDREPTWRANFSAGSTFGRDDMFGVVVGFDYSNRNFEIPQIETDDADYTEFDEAGNNVGLGNGNGVVVPTNNRQFFYNNVRERIGALIKGEVRLDDRFRADIAYSYNEYNDNERRDEQRYELGTGTGSNQPAVIRNQTATTGVTDTGFNIIGIGRFTLDREITSLRGSLAWNITDDLELRARAVHSTAELDNPEITEAFQTGNDLGAQFDVKSFFPQIMPLDPEAFFDPASYVFQNRGVLDRFAEDEIQEYKADLVWRPAQIEDLTLKAGGLFRSAEKSEGFSFERFVAEDGFDYRLDRVVDTTLTDADFQGGYFFPNRIDIPASDAVAEDSLVSSFTTSNGSIAEEDVLAGYAMGIWSKGPWTVTGGVRVERTEFEGGPDGGEVVSGEYTDVLPSANVRYDLRDNVVVRAAASQTLGRPDPNQLVRGVSINTAENTISRSNPDLDSRRSNNFDLTAEWYLRDGILAAGIFYKDIKDEIFFQRTDGPVTVDGITYDAISQPENAFDAEIFGLEAQYQQTFGFLAPPLDGLGVSANVTWLDAEFTVPFGDGTRTTGFPQQPDLAYNLTGFYATEFFEIRATYNFTDQFIDLIDDSDVDLDEYWDSRETVDMQARFNLTERFTLIGEVQNLTDTGRRELTGPGADFLQEDARFGRTVWIGGAASF